MLEHDFWGTFRKWSPHQSAEKGEKDGKRLEHMDP